MTRVLQAGAALFAALLAGATWAQGQEVSDGERLTLPIPAVTANSAVLSQDFYIDVPAGARALRIELNTASDRDIDILAKVDEPIDAGAILTPGDAFGLADFSSGGFAGDELVVIADYSTPLLAGRRWYFNMYSFPGSGGTAQMDVDVIFDDPPNLEVIVDFDNALGEANCDTAPWNDTTPREPAGGNPGTTLGQQRRNAINESVRLITRDLFSYVPVRVRACWENLGEDEDTGGATLASASPRNLVINPSGAELEDHWYAAAPAARLGGATSCRVGILGDCDSHELLIRFNTDVDTDEALGPRSFYYGFDRDAGEFSDADFISVAMHELTHALGYLSTLEEDGSLLTANSGVPFGDVFTAQLVDFTTGEPVAMLAPELTDADRFDAMTSVSDLQWQGHEAYVTGENGLATIEVGLLRMHAPAEYNRGSSVSHIATTHCDLMNANISVCSDGPHRELDFAKPILHAVGWAPAPRTPPVFGLMYDPGRSGHGFEFQLGGVNNQGVPQYVLTFYSYRNSGRPEWFQAAGPYANGAFSPRRDVLDNTMYELVYTPAPDNDGSAEREPNHHGHAVLSFNDAENHPACNDGVARTGTKAVFGFITDNSADDWCVVPLIPREQRTESDFAGLWYAGPDDSFWGFSLEDVARSDGTTDIFLLLYVYDDDGMAAWYQGFADEIELGEPVTFDLEQFDGYGRTRMVVPTEKDVAGTMTLTLVSTEDDLDAGNRMSVNVEFLNAPGGVWVRDDIPIVRFSKPRSD